MWESLFAGVLALASNLPPLEWPQTIYITHEYVEKISCVGIKDGAFRAWSGTGFKLADGRWMSANHVTEDGVCTIDGKPLTVINADPRGDVSVFTLPDDRKGGFQVNCIGFSDRNWYFGIGHGRGDPWPQIVAVRYSALFTMFGGGPLGILEYNRFVPGMSGGPVVDQTGRVTGVVNAYGLGIKISFSRQLRDTVICQNSASAAR